MEELEIYIGPETPDPSKVDEMDQNLTSITTNMGNPSNSNWKNYSNKKKTSYPEKRGFSGRNL